MTRTTKRPLDTSPPSPTSYEWLARRPENDIPYRLVTRWADLRNGCRDGRLHHKANRPPVTLLPPDSTAYQRALSAELATRQAREQLKYEATSLPLQAELATALAALAALHDADMHARQALDDLDHVPPVDVLDVRRGTEHHDGTSSERVRARRLHEYQRDVLAPARSRAATTAAQLKQVTDRVHDLEGTLAALATVLAERMAQLEGHYARRNATYERAYLRRVPQRAQLSPIRTIHN